MTTRLRDAARVLRRELDANMMLPAPIHAALVALVDEHDPEGAHAAREARSDEVTTELPVGPRR